MNKDLYFLLTKHLIFTFLALIIMILISMIKTEFLLSHVIPLFVVSFVFYTSAIFGVVKGAKRWLDFYLFRLQPMKY